MNAAPATDHAAILAVLPLRQRPTLRLEPAEPRPGDLAAFTILEQNADDCGDAAIIGLAILGQGGWYLGCIECRAEIEEADSGMCRPWQDAAFCDQQHEESGEDW